MVKVDIHFTSVLESLPSYICMYVYMSIHFLTTLISPCSVSSSLVPPPVTEAWILVVADRGGQTPDILYLSSSKDACVKRYYSESCATKCTQTVCVRADVCWDDRNVVRCCCIMSSSLWPPSINTLKDIVKPKVMSLLWKCKEKKEAIFVLKHRE